MDRLTFSQLDAPAAGTDTTVGGSSFKGAPAGQEGFDIYCPTQKLFDDDVVGDGVAAPVLSAHKQSRRRRYACSDTICTFLTL